MKEYNVLEASGLCMNGNPAIYEPYTIQQGWFRVVHAIKDNTNFNFGGVSLKEFHNAARSLANAGLNPFKN